MTRKYPIHTKPARSHLKWVDSDSNKSVFIEFGWFFFIIPAFVFGKKWYINFVSKSARRPSIPPSSVRASIKFLVNVSPPKPLDVATSNFVAE